MQCYIKCTKKTPYGLSIQSIKLTLLNTLLRALIPNLFSINNLHDLFPEVFGEHFTGDC